MKSNRILVVIVMVLILINCALLGFLWLNVYQVKKQRPPIQGPAFEFLSRELQLTSTQKTQYEKLRDAHRQLVDSLNTQSRMLHDSLFEGLKNQALKPAITTGLAKKIAEITAKVDTSTFYHFKRFRAILTTAQQEKFDNVIQDILHGMGGSPQGPPGQRGPQGVSPGPPQEGPPPNGKDRRRMPRPGGPKGPRGNDEQHPGGPPPGWPPPNGGRPGMPPPGGPPPDGRPPSGPPPNGGPPPGGGPPPQS